MDKLRLKNSGKMATKATKRNVITLSILFPIFAGVVTYAFIITSQRTKRLDADHEYTFGIVTEVNISPQSKYTVVMCDYKVNDKVYWVPAHFYPGFQSFHFGDTCVVKYEPADPDNHKLLSYYVWKNGKQSRKSLVINKSDFPLMSADEFMTFAKEKGF